jgi:ribosome recycling factor
MNEEITFYLDIAKEQMQECVSHLEVILSKIRAGKASPQMLRTVYVDYYGSSTPLSQTANVSTPDAQTISIQPFDKTTIPLIEQAIVNANLGFNPSNNGEKVIINVPPLTEERRRDLVKQTKVEIEKAKVSSRNIRQKTNDEIKKLAKEGVSEDLVRDAEEQVQELTNQFTKKFDSIFATKEAEIMTV